MAISYNDYKNKYKKQLEEAEQYHFAQKKQEHINNMSSKEAKAEYKNKTYEKQNAIKDFRNIYKQNNIVVNDSSLNPTATPTTYQNKTIGVDYNKGASLNPSEELIEKQKKSFENYEKFNEFNEKNKNLVNEKKQNVIQKYNETAQAFSNYQQKKLDEDNIRIYDKTLGRVIGGMTSPFSQFAGEQAINENGDLYYLPSYNDLKQQKVLDSYGNSFLDKVAKVGTSALYEGGKLVTSAVLNKLAPGLGTTSYFSDMYTKQLNEAVSEGYSEGRSLAYASLSTATEFATEIALGGTTKFIFGGNASSELSKNISVALSKTFTKNPRLVNAIANAISEGGEEFLQEFIDVFSRNITLGEKENPFTMETLENAIYSGAVGALTGAFSGATDSNDYFKLKKQRQEYVDNAAKLPTSNNFGKDIINDGKNTKIDLENKLPSVNYNIGTDIDSKLNKINLPLKEDLNTTINSRINLPMNEMTNTQNGNYQYNVTSNQKINNLRESASKYFDNSQDIQNLVNVAEKLINDKNYNITFDNNIKDTKGNIVDGVIKKLDNGEVSIKINPNSKRSGEFLLVHEITHAIETPELRNFIIDYAKKNPVFAESVKALETMYEASEVTGETVADISANLFGNQEFINNLRMDNSAQAKTIIQKIYEAIKTFLNNFTTEGREKNFVKKLEEMWRQAYITQTSNIIKPTYSIVGLNGLKNLDISNYKSKGLYYYQEALKLKKQGIDNETIRKQTKWFQDKNGDWKFEVEDNSLKLKINVLKKDGIYKLEDIINHSYLFKLYPELKKIDVVFKDIKGLGSYNNEYKRIRVSNNFLKVKDYKGLSGTLLHEIQHAIQNIENFETGQSAKLSKKNYYEGLGEIEADDTKDRYLKKYNKEDRANIAPESSKSDPKHSQYDDYMNNRKTIDKIKDKVYSHIERKLRNVKNNQEIISSSSLQNNRLVDGRELDNSSFSFADAKRYDDLIKTNYIEYFRKDDGDVKVYFMDSNNNLVNEFNIWSNTNAIKELGADLGNKIYETASDTHQKIEINNDINNLGTETDYFMNHRPSEGYGNASNFEANMSGIFEHPEWYLNLNEKYNNESLNALKKVRNNPEAEITIYRATPGNKINVGDWVTPSKSYAEYHNNTQFNGKGNILEMKVKAKDILFAGDDINEFGYFPDDNTKYSQYNSKWQEHLDEYYKPTGTRTDMSKHLIPLRDDVNKLANIPIKEDINNNGIDIDTPEKLAEILKEKPKTIEEKDGRLKKLATIKFIDKGYYIDKLAKSAKNKELSSKYDYSLLANGIANNIIGNGRVDEKGNKIGKGLYEIFEPIENSGLIDDFSKYIYHKHNVDRMSLSTRYSEENKAVFGDGMTSEKSDKIVKDYESKYPEFETWAKDIYKYNQANLEMLVEYGVISKESLEYYNKKYPHYVPTIRDNTKVKTQMDIFLGKKAKVNNPVKKAKGGNSDIIPLKDAMALRTMQTVNSALRNNFGLELMNTIEVEATKLKQDVDSTVEEINFEDLLTEKSKENPATLTIFQDGEKITFAIPDEIYEALKPSNIYTFKALNKLNNIRRGLLTEYNPTFMITNPLKDIQDGSINSKHPTTFAKNLVEATKQIKNKGMYYQLYIANGGSYETYFNYNTGTNIAPSKIDKIMPLKKISEINEVIEMTPRLAEFISSIEAGDSIETAMYNASEITTNFKRGGDITKTLDRNGVTFLNAGVQGAVKQIRNMQEARVEGMKGLSKLVVRWTIAGLAPSLLMSMIWDDDKDYEELSDYIKNNYYIIGKYDNGQFIRIPKGRVVSVLQKFFQNIIDKADGKEMDIDGFIDLLENNILPSDPNESSLIAPLKQAVKNETWYGGELVPTRLQNLPNSEQYDESTDSISIWLGKKLNISPYKINYVLDQYTGAIGDYTLPYLTQQAESGSDGFTGKLIAPIKDKFTADSVFKNQNVTDFYSTSEELTKKSNSSNANDEDKLKNKYINSIKSKMSKLYAEKRKIQSSDKKDSIKYKESREIQKQIDELAKNGLNNYKNVVSYENYGRVLEQEYYLNSKLEWTKVKDKEKEEINKLNMSDTDKNKYFKAKVKIGVICSEKEKESDAKHKEIADLVVKSELNDELKGYLYSKYYSSEDTLNDIVTLKIPMDQYIKFDSQNFDGKYNTNTGKTINGSRKNEVINYVNSLNLTIPQKAILIKSKYNSYDNYNNQIINYVNALNKSANDKKILLKSIGFDNYNKDIVNYINSQNITKSEKEKKLKKLGFTIRDGRVYW